MGVVFDEPPPQSPGFHTYERIRLRIEVGRPAEHFHGDRVTLEALAVARERLLDHEAQELRRARGLLEVSAAEDVVELGLDVARVGLPRSRSGF
jgi:hypothetical protein